MGRVEGFHLHESANPWASKALALDHRARHPGSVLLGLVRPQKGTLSDCLCDVIPAAPLGVPSAPFWRRAFSHTLSPSAEGEMSNVRDHVRTVKRKSSPWPAGPRTDGMTVARGYRPGRSPCGCSDRGGHRRGEVTHAVSRAAPVVMVVSLRVSMLTNLNDLGLPDPVAGCEHRWSRLRWAVVVVVNVDEPLVHVGVVLNLRGELASAAALCRRDLSNPSHLFGCGPRRTWEDDH